MSQDFRFDANILFEMLDSDIKCDLLDLHTVSKSFIHCKAPATKSAWSGEKIWIGFLKMRRSSGHVAWCMPLSFLVLRHSEVVASLFDSGASLPQHPAATYCANMCKLCAKSGRKWLEKPNLKTQTWIEVSSSHKRSIVKQKETYRCQGKQAIPGHTRPLGENMSELEDGWSSNVFEPARIPFSEVKVQFQHATVVISRENGRHIAQHLVSVSAKSCQLVNCP